MTYPIAYATMLAARGGISAGPQGLGLMVSDDAANCPKGWIFLKLGEATAEQVADALVTLRSGRSAWPESSEPKRAR